RSARPRSRSDVGLACSATKGVQSDACFGLSIIRPTAISERPRTFGTLLKSAPPGNLSKVSDLHPYATFTVMASWLFGVPLEHFETLVLADPPVLFMAWTHPANSGLGGRCIGTCKQRRLTP